MSRRAGWEYDEMDQSGVDYGALEHVEAYDRRHQRIRDYEKEARSIIDKLGLVERDTVIDLGCGTGAFVLNAAKHCAKIYAVDVSEVMLEHTRKKAKEAELDNIEFCHGGFLTYEHAGDEVDAIVSGLALHHLPDFWKMIAIRNMAGMLKEGGKLYLYDVVFSFDVAEYENWLDKWSEMFGDEANDGLSPEAMLHVREEFSTLDWIMEGLIERAGFRIEHTEYEDEFRAGYLCVKV